MNSHALKRTGGRFSSCSGLFVSVLCYSSPARWRVLSDLGGGEDRDYNTCMEEGIKQVGMAVEEIGVEIVDDLPAFLEELTVLSKFLRALRKPISTSAASANIPILPFLRSSLIVSPSSFENGRQLMHG